MKTQLLFLLIAVVSLLGCASSEPHACTPSGIAWHRPVFSKGLETIRNRVILNRNGDLFWNGSAVSNGQFRKMLEAARKLSPQPELYLQAEMGVPCRDLDRVRSEVAAALGCHDAKGLCVEGLPDNHPPF